MFHNILQSSKTALKRINKPIMFKILFGAFFCFVILGLMLFLHQFAGGAKDRRKRMPSVKIAPENIWLQTEPLHLDPIQFSREQKKLWNSDDVEKFFVEPNDDVLNELHEKNTGKIMHLLDGVK